MKKVWIGPLKQPLMRSREITEDHEREEAWTEIRRFSAVPIRGSVHQMRSLQSDMR